MAAIVYNTIPSWDTFEKDSSIVFGIRSNDSLLRQIDATLISFQGMRHLTASQAALEQLLSLGRLYFAVDLWLKEFARKVGDAGRKPAQTGKPTTVASRCKHCSGLSSEVLSKASAAARAA